jgi:hypothetical protein
MSEFNEIAYRLNYDDNHYRGFRSASTEEDIVFQKYDGYEEFSMSRLSLFEHPTPVIFTGNLDSVRFIDYPLNSGWEVMSRKMYETLLSVGDFPHRIIPVVIIDSKIKEKDWFNNNGGLKQDVGLWNYIAVHITGTIDVVDYEKSSYTQDEKLKRIRIYTYVFKNPTNGLPPIFRTPENLFPVFVSAEAREALKRNKIKGIRYVSAKDGEEWIDTPIDLPD